MHYLFILVIATVVYLSNIYYAHTKYIKLKPIIKNIVVYSDSSTDNGNVYKITGFPPSPPYYEGRYTNGPVWLDHVTDDFSHIDVANIAYGGATTNSKHVSYATKDYPIPSIKELIDTIPVTGNEQSLFVIFAGGNDVLSLIIPEIFVSVSEKYTIEKVAANIVDIIRSIHKKYNVKEFLFMNSTPLDAFGPIPWTDTERKTLKGLINRFNVLVEKLVKEMDDVNVNLLDTNGWFLDTMSRAEELGLNATNGACLNNYESDEELIVCDDPDKHFFWDIYHPVAKVQMKLGRWVGDKMKELYNI